ncbi:DUF5817 domain-containing protein [Halovivax gelatinilyticus]|uniref:DUF5817 domain-containing protein n=1 Tax=Halovivax gelatinilyticus TaxID=2961597 RepID=UPI0020CA31C7|nr:DUF5817 domain-containing protein [Halovivax gelatinilyticus]
MYAVVGCSECSHLWLIEGRSETTTCPRCGSQKRYEQRRAFVETDDVDHAREVRASMLANRQGEGEAFASVDSFADLDDEVDGGVIDDAEYLEGSGLDPDEIDAAGDRRVRGSSAHGSRREIVERAIETLDEPTESAIVDYAGDRGVPADATTAIVEKLVRNGDVSESRGTYRLL